MIKGLNMFLVPIKLVSFGFSSYKKVILILIQTFSKILVLVPTVSLLSLNGDVDDGETCHPINVVA